MIKLEILTTGFPICYADRCTNKYNCAQHNSAGDLRTEDGERPNLTYNDGECHCDETTLEHEIGALSIKSGSLKYFEWEPSVFRAKIHFADISYYIAQFHVCVETCNYYTVMYNKQDGLVISSSLSEGLKADFLTDNQEYLKKNILAYFNDGERSLSVKLYEV